MHNQNNMKAWNFVENFEILKKNAETFLEKLRIRTFIAHWIFKVKAWSGSKIALISQIFLNFSCEFSPYTNKKTSAFVIWKKMQ